MRAAGPALLLALACGRLAAEPDALFQASPRLQAWAAQRLGAGGVELARELGAARDRVTAIDCFHRFAQRQLELGMGDGWVAELLSGPLAGEVAALGAELYPREITVVRVVARDGKTLTGIASSLTESFAPNDPKLARGIGDQFELVVGRGLPSRSYGLWVDAGDVRSRSEAKVPAPALFAADVRGRENGADGSLRLVVTAVTPPGPPRVETVVLEPRYVEAGGGLFVDASAGLEWFERPGGTPEEIRWWVRARRRAEGDAPEADLRAAELALELRALDSARTYLDAAKAEPRTAPAAARREAEWTRLRIAELLQPARDAAARGELDAALRALSDIPEPGRAAADALAAELQTDLEAVAAFLDAFRAAREATPEAQRPVWAADDPAPARLDPARCAAARGAAGGLAGLWIAYHYGLPALPPDAVTRIEEKARAFLAASGNEGAPALEALLAEAESTALSPRDVLRIVRSVPWLEPAPGPGRLEFPHPTRGTHHACVAFPAGYGPWKRVPVYVSHHGQGGSAEEWFEAPHREETLALGAAFAAPEYGSGSGVGHALQDDQDTLALVRFLRLRTNVDPDRFYLGGCSMGGAQSWYLSQTYPDAWAGAAPDARAPSSPLLPTLLRNLASLPLYHIQGQFNGRSNVVTREALPRLAAWKADMVYREPGLFGHDAAWRIYPEALRWMLARARAAPAREVWLGTCKGYAAERAWLRVRSLKRPAAWAKTDGGYSPGDLVGLSARVRDGAIELEVEGDDRARLREIELLLDDALWGDATEIPIRFRRKTIATWKPEWRLRRALEEIRRRGDRARGYGAALVLEATGEGFRAK